MRACVGIFYEVLFSCVENLYIWQNHLKEKTKPIYLDGKKLNISRDFMDHKNNPLTSAL